jgi:hypothetical protein
MSFNQGWFCKECGPVKESKKRSIAKVQYDCCKDCGGIVTEWERPLNERAGRCRNCAASGFEMAIHKGHLIRNCKTCNEVYDIDADKLIQKGKEEFKYERSKKQRIG